MNETRAALVAVAAIAAASAAGCRSKKPPAPAVDAAMLGEIAARDDVDFAPYLATARAIVQKSERPKELPPKLGAQRAFVTVWAPGRDPVVASALGDSLMASVVAASEAAAASAVPSPELRVQIDVVKSLETAPSLAGEIRRPIHEVGLRGYLTRRGDRLGAVLPGEVSTFHWFDADSARDGDVRLARDRIAEKLAARTGVELGALDEMPITTVATTSRVDSSPPGRAIPLFRGMPLRPATMTPEALVAAARSGGDYLARALDPKGHFAYVVHADDTVDTGYSILRHAGSTMAMLDVYAETGDPAILRKAESALAYLELALRGTPFGAYAGDNANEEQQKSGGAGLSMVVFVRHRELTGKKTYTAALRALTKFLLHQQYSDGHFRANADVEREDPSAKEKKLPTEVIYYAGEAALGLVRLYGLEKDPAILEAAKKAADYLVHVRDAGKNEDTLPHDAWLSYTLLDLWRATKNEEYAAHALAIARSIVKAEVTPERAAEPDYVGTFYKFGETTPSATRLEALTAAFELGREAGKDTKWIEPSMMRIACFLRGQQYDEDSAFFVRRPSRMLGGVRAGLMNQSVRIDYVQHAMSGWLRLARLLRGQRGDSAPVVVLDAGVDAAASK